MRHAVHTGADNAGVNLQLKLFRIQIPKAQQSWLLPLQQLEYLGLSSI